MVTTQGKRWIYRTQKGKRQRQVTLGHYPAMSLAEAPEARARPITKGADK
ncbi:Arm DNA-binding domain-containing protein [Ruegeria sp. THAF57]